MRSGKKIKIIGMLLLILMAVSAIGTTAEARARGRIFNSNKIWYHEIAKDKVAVCGTTQKKGTLTIPAYVTYKGRTYQVTEISTYQEGGGLGILYYKKIEKVILPNTLTHIKDYAFFASDELKEVVFAKNYKKLIIGESAFWGCDKLKKIKFPEGTYELKANAAGDIPEIYIPSTVKKISPKVITDYTKKVTLSKKNKHFKMKAGILYSYDEKKLIRAFCAVKKHVKISSKTKTIGKNAFEGCRRMESIALNKNITTIPKEAFAGCSNLKKVTNTQKIKKINESAFNGCEVLEDMGELPVLTTIGKRAFAGDEKLTITISSKMNIHNRAFGGNYFYNICANAPTVKVAENDPVYSIVNGLLIKKDRAEQIVMLQTEEVEELTVPEGVTQIETHLGSDKLKKITFPASLKLLNDDVWMKGTPDEDELYYVDAEGEMYFKGMVPPKFCTEFSDANIPSIKTIYVPKGTLEAYKQAIADSGERYELFLEKVEFVEY